MFDLLAAFFTQILSINELSFNELSFAFPWVFLLLPLPLLAYHYLPVYNPPEEVIRVPFLNLLMEATGQKRFNQDTPATMPVMQKALAVICWLLLVFAAAGPREIQPPESRELPVRDILLVLDTSGSMKTVDFELPNGKQQMRMEAVKDVVADFIQQRPDDRLGLVIFGSGAFPQAPFSADHKALKTVLNGIEAGVAGEQTALGDAIGVAIRMFDQSKTKEKMVILLTDGNDTASTLPPSVATDLAAKKSIQIHTIAIGTETAKDDAAKVDTAMLQRIASETGGMAFEGADKQQLTEIYAEIDRITPHMQERFTWATHKPLFMWPLLLVLILLGSSFLLNLLVRIVRYQTVKDDSSEASTLHGEA